MFLGRRIPPERFRKYFYTFDDFVTLQCTVEAKSILIELRITAYLLFEVLNTSLFVPRRSAFEPVEQGLSPKALPVAS